MADNQPKPIRKCKKSVKNHYAGKTGKVIKTYGNLGNLGNLGDYIMKWVSFYK